MCFVVYETGIGSLDEVCEKSFQCLKIRISELCLGCKEVLVTYAYGLLATDMSIIAEA